MTRARGYTLVEVLIAVTVFAVLAASAYTALDGLSRAALEHRERSQQFAALQLAVARLDADLRQLITRPVRNPDGRAQPALAGEGQRLTATRAGWVNPAGARRGNLQRFAWELRDGELIRRDWPVTDRTAGTQVFEEPVLADVEALTLRYRSPGGGWQERWPGDGGDIERLPSAVEVVLSTRRFGTVRRLLVLEP